LTIKRARKRGGKKHVFWCLFNKNNMHKETKQMEVFMKAVRLFLVVFISIAAIYSTNASACQAGVQLIQNHVQNCEQIKGMINQRDNDLSACKDAERDLILAIFGSSDNGWKSDDKKDAVDTKAQLETVDKMATALVKVASEDSTVLAATEVDAAAAQVDSLKADTAVTKASASAAQAQAPAKKPGSIDVCDALENAISACGNAAARKVAIDVAKNAELAKASSDLAAVSAEPAEATAKLAAAVTATVEPEEAMKLTEAPAQLQAPTSDNDATAKLYKLVIDRIANHKYPDPATFFSTLESFMSCDANLCNAAGPAAPKVPAAPAAPVKAAAK
jgi:hypothetical protein